MKRKYFSALLMGALTVASVSTMTSCKDYDDDINGLSTEITNNASTLTQMVDEKVKNLTTELTNLKSQQAALEKALESAQSTLDEAIKKAETDSKAYADVQAAAAQKAAIEAAQANLDEAIKVINAAIDAANKRIDDVNSKVTTNSEAISKLVDADQELQQAINIVKADAAAASKKALDAAMAAQKTADENKEQIAANLATTSENLQKVKDELEKSISLLGKKVDDNTTAIAANAAEVKAKLAEVNSLIDTNKKALEEADSKLQGQITENLNKLTDLGAKLTALEKLCNENLVAAKAYTDAEIAKAKVVLGDDIKRVKGDLAAAVTRITTAENSITDISGKLTEFINKQNGKNDEIDGQIKEAMNKIQGNADVFAAAVVDLTKQITDAKTELSKAIEAAKTELNGTIETKVSEIQNAMQSLEEKVGQNATDIANLKTTLDELSQKLTREYVTNDNLNEYKQHVTSEITDAINRKSAELTANYTQAVGEVSNKIGDLSGLEGGSTVAALIRDLQNKISQITGDAGYVSSLQNQIDETNEKLKEYATVSSVSDLSGKLATLRTDFDTLKANWDKFLGNYDFNDGSISEYISGKVEDLNIHMTQLNNALQNLIDEMVGAANRQLKALVFSPEAYWQGIEAIDVNSFEYNAKQVAAADLDKDQTSDAPASFTPNVAIKVVPEVRASYFLNPSNAAVDFDASKYSFIVNNAKVSRASSSDIKVSKVEAGDAVGKINVYFNMADATKLLNGTQENGYKVDVAALRYKYCTKEGAKDTIVTSDFAALKKYRISGFTLRKVATEGTVDKADAVCTKLAKNAADALASTAPTLSVAYKDDAESGSKKTIDLDKWIDVHYSINSAPSTLWGGQETVNKKNFHLEYETIGYITGANNTNESKHAKLSGEHGHILEAVGVNNENGRQIIGRTPLLRVKLVDDNSKKIAAVGYIKVVIEDIAQKPITIEDKFNTEAKYTVGCTGEDVLGYKTTWDQIENEVLADLDMSKSEFEGTYKLDATSETSSIANQYMIDANGKFVANTDACGTIKYSATDPASHETNILTWGVSEADAYKFFITEKKAKVETWIKFTPKNATTAQLKDIYVKFAWTPVVNKDPKVTVLSNDIKKYAAWHAHESVAQGYDELEMEVGNATQAGDPCAYQNLKIANTFSTQPLEYVKEQLKNAGYTNMAAAASLRYEFVENDYTYPGHVIRIETTSENSKVYSNNVCIATLSREGVVYLSDKPETKTLLNMYKGKNDLKHALTFTVQAKVSFCDNADKLVTVNADKFNVRVIKPIAVNGETSVSMTLNNQSTLTKTVDLSANLVDFNGYNQAQFFTNSGKAVKFVDYYGITGITVDEANITTNYSNGSENTEVWKEVDPADFEIKLTPTTPLAYESATGVVKDWGTVKLKQINQNRPASFKVLIPVKISYKWGTCKTNVIVTVNKAGTGLAKKH